MGHLRCLPGALVLVCKINILSFWSLGSLSLLQLASLCLLVLSIAAPVVPLWPLLVSLWSPSTSALPWRRPSVPPMSPPWDPSAAHGIPTAPQCIPMASPWHPSGFPLRPHGPPQTAADVYRNIAMWLPLEGPLLTISTNGATSDPKASRRNPKMD